MALKNTTSKKASKRNLNLSSIGSVAIGVLLIFVFVFPVSWSISSIFYVTGYLFSFSSIFYGVLLSIYLLSSIAFSLLLIKFGLLSLEKKLGPLVFASSILVLAISLVISSIGVNGILSSLYYSYSFPSSSVLNTTNLAVAILLILGLAIGVICTLLAFVNGAHTHEKYDYFGILLPFVFVITLLWSSTPNTLETSFGTILYFISAVMILFSLIKRTW